MDYINNKVSPNDWYKVSALVDDWVDDHDLHNFWHKALKWAIRGLEEVRLNYAGDVKTCLLTVSDRKTVTLPDDFVDWVKVGAAVGQYCITLGVNDDLRLTTRTADAQTVNLLSQNPPNGIEFSNYDGFYFFNYDGAQIFGIGAGISSKGFFRVYDNGTCKELLLDYDFGCSQVYIEYITNGFDPCGESVISPYLKQYLFAYLDEIYERRNNPKATNYTKEAAEQRLGNAIVILRANRSNLTPQVMLNLGRKGFKLTSKI